MSIGRHQKVRAAVVIVVSDAHALRPSERSQARLLGYVFKAAVSQIAIQRGGAFVGRRFWMKPSSISDKDIVLAVAVVIENSDSVAGGLQNVIFATSPAIDIDDV